MVGRDGSASGNEVTWTWDAWLAEAMLIRRMTRADLIAAVGTDAAGRAILTRSQLSHWLNGTSRPSLRNLFRVVDAVEGDLDTAIAAAGYSRRRTTIHTSSAAGNPAEAAATARRQAPTKPGATVLIEVPASDEPLVRAFLTWLDTTRRGS